MTSMSCHCPSEPPAESNSGANLCSRLPCIGNSDILLVCLLILLAVASWFLALQYRGASDFTDTLGYMAQAKYLVGERQFNPARISWENFARGEVNPNATMSYPGQLFSLGIGTVAKILNRPLEMWMIVAFNFFVYVLCSVLCLLLLLRHLRGWEFLLVGFFSLTNYFVLCACASTGTDGLGFAFLLLALWLGSLQKKRPLIIGLVFGTSFFVRAHLAIFALFFPLLLSDKINRHAIRSTCLFVLGIVCAYGGVFGVLKLYVIPQLPPPVVAHVEKSGNQVPTSDSSDRESFSTFGWYNRQISESLPTLKQYGIGWITLGAYKTLGPASWCFGPLFFFVAAALLFKWGNPHITRYALYLVCTFATFYGAAYMLLVPAPTEKMIGELSTLGRYFCYFFPLLPLVFWLIVRESLPQELTFFPFFEKIKQRLFGQAMDARLMATGILFCFVFPSCFGIWGYGAALLAKIPVRQGTFFFQGDVVLRKELDAFPPESVVMSSRYTAVQVFSPIKRVVQCPASFDDFLQNETNRLLEGLVMFPKNVNATIKMTDTEQARWLEELNKDLIVDAHGNQFVKVCSHQGEGGDEDLVNKRTFVVFRRVGSLGFHPEPF